MSLRALRTLTAAMLLAATAGTALAVDPYLSAIYVNAPGGGDQGSETVAIGGDAGFSLNNYFLVIVEGDTNNGGTIDAVINLSAYSTGSNGLLLIRDTATVLNPAPAAGTSVVVRDFNPDIENGGNTFMLMRGPLSFGAGDDIDTNNDGTVDVAFTGTVVDAVSWVDGDAGGLDYADDVGGIDYGQTPFFTPDAGYRICDPDGNPTLFVIGDVLGTPPGPVSWTSSEHVGWQLIGINPDAKVLELGIPNYRVEEFVSVDVPRGRVTINGLPLDLGGEIVELSESADQPNFYGTSTFRGLSVESLLPPPSAWWVNLLTKYQVSMLPPELFAAKGATATITIDMGPGIGSLTDVVTTQRGADKSMVLRHVFSGSLTLPGGTPSLPFEKRDMQFTFNPDGTGSGSATLAAEVDGLQVILPITYTITYTSPTPIASPLSFTGAASITAYDDLTGEFSGTATRVPAAPACIVDLNMDGVVDFGDYLEFLNLFDAQDPRVDFNGDGVIDFADYLEFLNLFDAGC